MRFLIENIKEIEPTGFYICYSCLKAAEKNCCVGCSCDDRHYIFYGPDATDCDELSQYD